MDFLGDFCKALLDQVVAVFLKRYEFSGGTQCVGDPESQHRAYSSLLGETFQPEVGVVVSNGRRVGAEELVEQLGETPPILVLRVYDVVGVVATAT